MRLLFSMLLVSVSFYSFASTNTDSNLETTHQTTPQELSAPEVINITLTAENDGWEETTIIAPETDNDTPLETADYSTEYGDDSLIDEQQESEDTLTYESTIAEDEPETELPGKDINYEINLHSSTHHLIAGRADSDIGKLLFKSRLMPSNEVKLSLKLKQSEQDDIELVAYFDLANFTMELDGSNGVLNKEHKKLLKITSTHLQHKFEKQYEDYDFPEHSLMLVQMLGYWSVSPEGFVHEKRTIVSQ